MTMTARYGTDLTLPEAIRERLNLTTDVPVRIIETRDGILLIPLLDVPMSQELADELAEWQSLGGESWNSFPYEENSSGGESTDQ